MTEDPTNQDPTNQDPTNQDPTNQDAADFRTVTAVQPGWTVGDLLAALEARPTEFIAGYDAATSTGRARRAGTADVDPWQRIDAGAPAKDLLAGEAHVVHVEQQADVDSAYRARRILAKRSERVLVVLDGAVPVSVFSLDTASAPNDPETLQWVTDLPDDESLMASRVLLLGTTPWLRTRIAREPVDGAGHVTTIDVAALKDRKISFGLIGENLVFRLPGEPEDRPHVDSEFLDPLGDDASYQVQLVPLAAGPAAVEIEIWFDDDENFPHDQRIEFRVIDVAAGVEPQPIAAVVVSTPFAVPPEASVWIRWDGDELAYDVDGQTRSHAIAASIGEFEGAELVGLIGEIERLAASYRSSSSDDALALDDDGAALVGFARVGARLHSMIYGADRFDVDDAIAARAAQIAELGHDGSVPRLRIEDDRFRLPWELMYDHGYTTAKGERSVRLPETVDDVDVSGFWGYRFRIDHPVARGDRTARRPGDHVLGQGPPRVTPFVNRRIADDTAVSDRLVAANDALLAELGERGATVEPPTDDLLGWVTRGAATDVVYFFGHGAGAGGEDALGRQVAAEADEQARLWLTDVDITVADLRAAEPSPPHLAGSPLVVLNACKALGGDVFYRNPFVDLFYRRWRARAVVGGVASLPASFAVGFADRMLGRFIDGDEQLGACVHSTVRELLDGGNPYGLLYALHGRSELQIRR